MKEKTSLPDQFEIFGQLVKDRRNSKMREAVAYSVAILSLFGMVLASNRPISVVVKSDIPGEDTYVVAAMDRYRIRETDAKKFLLKSSKLLHGWNSAGVADDLFEATSLMTPEWRSKFISYADEMIKVDKTVHPDGETERLTTWELANIRNVVDLDWSKTECKQEKKVWFCRGRGTLETHPLKGFTRSTKKASKQIEVRAAFVEVPLTRESLDGLLISYYDLVEVKS